MQSGVNGCRHVLVSRFWTYRGFPFIGASKRGWPLCFWVRILLFSVHYPIFNTLRTNGSRTIIYPLRSWGIIIFFEFYFKVCGDIVRHGIWCLFLNVLTHFWTPLFWLNINYFCSRRFEFTVCFVFSFQTWLRKPFGIAYQCGKVC